MPDWNDGAITDIAARRRFHRETTPVWLVTACTILGCRSPSLSKPFRYADLGCGAGFNALIIAATWGFDFNPANIEVARDLAEQAGLTNVRFMEISFEAMEALPPDALPEFDFMIAEAVLSVVSPENRRRIHGLIGRHLRPGGLAYLGYSCDTGWTEFTALQTLMRMLFESGSDASDFAVGEIFAYLDRLKTGGAVYFIRNPVLDRRMSEVRQRPAGDLALELLNRDWHALMFADVADAMAEAKCEFLGRATLHENIAAFGAPPAMQPLLEEAASIRIRETMQDVAAATEYRRDIYRRGLTFLPIADHHAQLETITVAAIRRGAIELPSWRGPETADPALYQPLADALGDGTLTVGQARTLGPLVKAPIEAAVDAVAMLIAAGHAHPVMPPLMAHEAAPVVARLNDAIIDAITRGEELSYLVSPLLGAAIETNPLEALTIGALQYGRDPADLDGLTESVMLAMRRGGRSVVRDGAPVEDEVEAASILRDIITHLLEQRVPLPGYQIRG